MPKRYSSYPPSVKRFFLKSGSQAVNLHPNMVKNPHAVALGKLGGLRTSEAKRKAAIANAKLPRKKLTILPIVSNPIDSIGENNSK